MGKGPDAGERDGRTEGAWHEGGHGRRGNESERVWQAMAGLWSLPQVFSRSEWPAFQRVENGEADLISPEGPILKE